MTFSLQSFKVPTFPNINDTPEIPTATKAGNGSHIISQYNSLVDISEGLLKQFNDSIDGLNQQVSNIPSAEGGYPRSFTHWHDASTVTNGSLLESINVADQPYSTVTRQIIPANQDSFTFVTPMRFGYWKLYALARTAPDAGMFEVYLNNNLITSSPIDLYSLTPAPITIQIPFDIEDSVECTFFIRCTGTSDTGFALPFTKFSIHN